MVKMRSWPNFASFNTSIHARSLNERGPHWIFGNAIDLQVSLCAGKKGTGGVCFCLKSNLPWLWLMSLRAEWQVAVVMERSTALPGLFVPGADGWEGVTCARLRDGVLKEDPWPQHSTTNSFAVSRLTCIHTHTHSWWVGLHNDAKYMEVCGYRSLWQVYLSKWSTKCLYDLCDQSEASFVSFIHRDSSSSPWTHTYKHMHTQ